jgi:hypothetical protein
MAPPCATQSYAASMAPANVASSTTFTFSASEGTVEKESTGIMFLSMNSVAPSWRRYSMWVCDAYVSDDLYKPKKLQKLDDCGAF